jgi:hypothetical protein
LTIFGIILAIAPFLLIDQVDSIPKGIGFLIAALALTAVLYGVIELWPEKATRWYVISVVFFYAIVNLLVWFGNLPRDIDTASTERRVRQLEQENAGLRQQVQKDEAAGRLLSFVGKDIERTCKTFISNTYFNGEQAAIECSVPDILNFSLALFPDVSIMNEDFSSAVELAKGITKGDVENCERNKPTEGEWQSTTGAGQGKAGRLLCYLDDDKDAWIQWTHDGLKIYAFAYRDDANIEALYDWWSRTWSTKS